MNEIIDQKVKLDLNNPVFQRQLFNLQKRDQGEVLGTLRKFSNMTWRQVYNNRGLKWEAIISRKGPVEEEYIVFESEKDSAVLLIEKMIGCGFCLFIPTMIQHMSEKFPVS